MNSFLELAAEKLGLCGHGKEGNWSVRIADYFFVDCGCCWFWRGAAFGGTVMSVFAIAIIAIVLLVRSI